MKDDDDDDLMSSGALTDQERARLEENFADSDESDEYHQGE